MGMKKGTNRSEKERKESDRRGRLDQRWRTQRSGGIDGLENHQGWINPKSRWKPKRRREKKSIRGKRITPKTTGTMERVQPTSNLPSR